MKNILTLTHCVMKNWTLSAIALAVMLTACGNTVGDIDTLSGDKGDDDIDGEDGDDIIGGGANSSTGAASRPQVAGKAHQCLVYTESRRGSAERAENWIQAANDACWRNAA